MSDNNVCPKCGKQKTITLGLYYVNDFCQCYTPADNPCPNCADMPAEIARMKAELEKAEMERDEWKEVFEREIDGARELRDDYGALDSETFPAFVERLHTERDEARKWARRYYREYQAAKRYFDNLFDDGNEYSVPTWTRRESEK